MPTHVYECLEGHGRFERQIPITLHIPRYQWCPKGLHKAPWRPSAPYFIVKGGTGAAKGGRDR